MNLSYVDRIGSLGRVAAGLLVAAATSTALAETAVMPTTRPSSQPTVATADTLAGVNIPDNRLELRANQAFNRGEYVTALPLLKKLAAEAQQQPSRLVAIQERIRVCEKALAAVNADPNAAKGPDTQPAAAARTPHPAPKAGETIELAIKDLGNFNYDQEHGGQIPADVKQLAGAQLRLHGYMIPLDQAENITQFALVPSLFACCYGQPPQIQHTIVVSCPKGKAVSYCPDEIVVEGKLNVQEKKDDGYVVSLFELTVNSVKAAPK